VARIEIIDEKGAQDALFEYKRQLAGVLDRRPSGTRQRLASALGKNRSFISQISSDAYATPIPASHVDTIFEICHFSPAERRRFVEAYRRAHPRRHAGTQDGHRLKAHTVYLPDMGDDAGNERLHGLLTEFVRSLVRIIKEGTAKGKGS
jgi:hypothetical protein